MKKMMVLFICTLFCFTSGFSECAELSIKCGAKKPHSAPRQPAPYSGEVQQKKPVRVYVDVVGDLFHSGHIEFFKKARAFGDYLIVGVLADEVVEEYKRTPILSLEERVKEIEACRYVDEVIVAPPLRLTEEMIRKYQIDYVVHGDDFNKDLIEDQYGVSYKLGIFRTVPYTQGISTTDIIQRIVSRYDEGEFHKK